MMKYSIFVTFMISQANKNRNAHTGTIDNRLLQKSALGVFLLDIGFHLSDAAVDRVIDNLLDLSRLKNLSWIKFCIQLYKDSGLNMYYFVFE